MPPSRPDDSGQFSRIHSIRSVKYESLKDESRPSIVSSEKLSEGVLMLSTKRHDVNRQQPLCTGTEHLPAVCRNTPFLSVLLIRRGYVAKVSWLLIDYLGGHCLAPARSASFAREDSNVLKKRKERHTLSASFNHYFLSATNAQSRCFPVHIHRHSDFKAESSERITPPSGPHRSVLCAPCSITNSCSHNLNHGLFPSRSQPRDHHGHRQNSI